MLISVILAFYLMALGTVVIIQRPVRRANFALFISSLIISLWMVVVAGVSSWAYDPTYARIVFATGMLSLTSLFVLTRQLTEDIGLRIISHVDLIIYSTFIAAMTYLTLATPLVISTTSYHAGYPVPVYGQLGWMYVSALILTTILTVWVLLDAYRQTTGKFRSQIRTVAFTIVVSVTLALTTNLIIPWLFGDASSSIWMPLSVALLMTGLTYAMIKNGLFDVRLVAVRTAAYILSMATMAGVYFGMAYLASVTIFHENVTTGISMSPVNIVLALVLAFLFQPIKRFFDRWTNKIFYRDRYEQNEFITRLGRILTATTKLNEVLERAADEIKSTLKSNTALFLVYREHHPNTFVGDVPRKKFTADELESFRDIPVMTGGGVLVVSDLEGAHVQAHRHLHSLLTRRSISLVLPLLGSDEIVGYLFLGEQKGGGYTHRDIDVLATIADELVIAVQNARSVQAVRELNRSLETRIASATQELRQSNETLLELDATKDEFVSMASHQLRTPLTSVKGYLSMVLEGDAGKLSPDQRKMINEAYVSSDRMVRLISDFLNVSRIQTGKFVLDKHPVYLADVVAEELAQLQSVAKSRNITLTYRRPRNIPMMELDEDKIRQVVMNYIDNAIFYSHEGSKVDVSLKFRDGEIVFGVKDHGIGIPKNQQAKLFQRFFRADNARKHRPDGTGVGLYLARKVITEHDGKIYFESVEGKGSTFGFRLYPPHQKS